MDISRDSSLYYETVTLNPIPFTIKLQTVTQTDCAGPLWLYGLNGNIRACTTYSCMRGSDRV